MKFVIFVIAIFLLSSASAGRRGSSNRRRGFGSVVKDFFGQIDWFEARDGRDDDCVPDEDTTTVTPLDPDDGTDAGEFDNFRRRGGGKGKEKFFSLASVSVCEGESIGTEKCICVRSPWGRMLNKDYKLKCGTCQMNFVPEGRSNNEGEEEGENGFRRRAGLIKLDEEAVDLNDGDDEFI